jgi:hypothetical protein
MRLTKTIRESFVRAAMQDVPKIDYDEQIQKLATQQAVAMMPTDVAKAYKTNPAWFRSEGHYLGTRLGYIYMPLPSGMSLTPEARGKIDSLATEKSKQIDARSALKNKLAAAAESVTTRKALVALLPEFEKYLPEDDAAACKTLPAVANLVADFTKAGWPKAKAAASK